MRCVAVLAMLLVVLLGAEATSPSLESLAEKKDQLVQLAQKAWNTAVNVGDKVVDKAADVADVVLGVSGSKQQPPVIIVEPAPRPVDAHNHPSPPQEQ
uniref:Spermatophylax protein 2b n=1 Tax=Gryllodes sigillatus TaxID=13551 RepID=A0A0P0AL06_9ORTH|nr:spermatophylax protein 2b [Gryllodes sigillatus]